jgi:four helix bundle protein
VQINHFTELRIYQASLALVRKFFEWSKAWPAEEKFALSGQIRRASRSVGANLAESWAKRRYEAHFVSRLTDADGENHETEHWLICARDCEDVSAAQFDELLQAKQEIGRRLGSMLQNPTPFLLK